MNRHASPVRTFTAAAWSAAGRLDHLKTRLGVVPKCFLNMLANALGLS